MIQLFFFITEAVLGDFEDSDYVNHKLLDYGDLGYPLGLGFYENDLVDENPPGEEEDQNYRNNFSILQQYAKNLIIDEINLVLSKLKKEEALAALEELCKEVNKEIKNLLKDENFENIDQAKEKIKNYSLKGLDEFIEKTRKEPMKTVIKFREIAREIKQLINSDIEKSKKDIYFDRAEIQVNDLENKVFTGIERLLEEGKEDKEIIKVIKIFWNLKFKDIIEQNKIGTWKVILRVETDENMEYMNTIMAHINQRISSIILPTNEDERGLEQSKIKLLHGKIMHWAEKEIVIREDKEAVEKEAIESFDLEFEEIKILGYKVNENNTEGEFAQRMLCFMNEFIKFVCWVIYK